MKNAILTTTEADAGKWSFHYKEMMEFINNEFYQKFNGGSVA